MVIFYKNKKGDTNNCANYSVIKLIRMKLWGIVAESSFQQESSISENPFCLCHIGSPRPFYWTLLIQKGI